MRDKLRFGIVGCGVIGVTHAEAIAGLSDAELVAVADVPAAASQAERLARRYGVHVYTDLQEMLDREELDVVDVCTPSGMHGEHACQIMRSGRHTIVEKPMDISLDAISEMLRVQQEMGVKLAVISQRRFEPAARRVHALVQEGAFGRLVLGVAQIPWWRSQAYYGSGAWRGTWALDGGGVLQTIPDPHLAALLDPANYLLTGSIPYPDGYQAVRSRLEYVHVKDAKDGAVVTAGEGECRFPELLRQMQADGYDGVFALEPHLKSAGPFRGFSGPDLFRHASQAFQRLLRAEGWAYQ